MGPSTSRGRFVDVADRLMGRLAEEGLARLALPSSIATPCGECAGLVPLDGDEMCVVSNILSEALAEAVRRLRPESRMGRVLPSHDQVPHELGLPHVKLPEGIDD